MVGAETGRRRKRCPRASGRRASQTNWKEHSTNTLAAGVAADSLVLILSLWQQCRGKSRASGQLLDTSRLAQRPVLPQLWRTGRLMTIRVANAPRSSRKVRVFSGFDPLITTNKQQIPTRHRCPSLLLAQPLAQKRRLL